MLLSAIDEQPCNALSATRHVTADYPLNRITSGEQLRVPLTDKAGESTGEINMSVNTGGYGSECRSADNMFCLDA